VTPKTSCLNDKKLKMNNLYSGDWNVYQHAVRHKGCSYNFSDAKGERYCNYPARSRRRRCCLL